MLYIFNTHVAAQSEFVLKLPLPFINKTLYNYAAFEKGFYTKTLFFYLILDAGA